MSDAARRRVVVTAGAAIYAFLFALCSQIDEQGFTVAGEGIKRFLLAFPCAVIVLHALFRRGLSHLEMQDKPKKWRPAVLLGVWFFIFCCYVPVFLFEYPGTFLYDTRTQVIYFVSGEYSEFHPLLHTLLLQFCMSLYDFLQSFELCAAVYSLIQMALLSFCFAVSSESISRSISERAAQISVLFFGLHPLHMLFASNCTKDVLFSACFTLFFALWIEKERVQMFSGRRMVLLFLSGVLACMLRNNMIYALAAWVLVLLVRNGAFRHMAVYGVLIIMLAGGMSAGLAAILQAEDGSVVEMLSVPVQQLARARQLMPEAFTQDEKDQMDRLFRANAESPQVTYEKYDPSISDPMKNRVDEEYLQNHFSDCVKLWMNVGRRCSRVYVDALLNLALGSLYPYTEYPVTRDYVEIEGDDLTGFYGVPHMVHPRRFASIREWIKSEICLTGADHRPIMRYLFNTGAYFWTLLLFLLYEMYSGSGRTVLFFLPVFLWGTYLLGPVMQGRYLYPFVCILPLFVLRPKNRTAIQNDVRRNN